MNRIPIIIVLLLIVAPCWAEMNPFLSPMLVCRDHPNDDPVQRAAGKRWATGFENCDAVETKFKAWAPSAAPDPAVKANRDAADRKLIDDHAKR